MWQGLTRFRRTTVGGGRRRRSFSCLLATRQRLQGLAETFQLPVCCGCCSCDAPDTSPSRRRPMAALRALLRPALRKELRTTRTLLIGLLAVVLAAAPFAVVRGLTGDGPAQWVQAGDTYWADEPATAALAA